MNFECIKQTFNEFFINNVHGTGNFWIFLYCTSIVFEGLKAFSVKSVSDNIIRLWVSNMTMQNSEIADFYPQFIYSSLSILVVNNCTFFDAYAEENSKLQRTAIFLENNNSFTLINNTFKSLANQNSGPVI